MATERCPTCDRPLPSEKSDAPAAGRRVRFSVAIPGGEEGLLDDLLEQLAERWWKEGERAQGWRYPVLHAVLYEAVASGWQPVEDEA